LVKTILKKEGKTAVEKCPKRIVGAGSKLFMKIANRKMRPQEGFLLGRLAALFLLFKGD
jgi:putative sterol carrier protein